jgi:hypothetical protein
VLSGKVLLDGKHEGDLLRDESWKSDSSSRSGISSIKLEKIIKKTTVTISHIEPTGAKGRIDEELNCFTEDIVLFSYVDSSNELSPYMCMVSTFVSSDGIDVLVELFFLCDAGFVDDFWNSRYYSLNCCFDVTNSLSEIGSVYEEVLRQFMGYVYSSEKGVSPRI